MAINWIEGVWANSKHSGSDLILLLALADSADRDTGSCYPGLKKLAQMTRTSIRNVQYRLKVLRDSGEVEVRYQRSPYGTNLFVLNRSLLGDEAQFTPMNHTSPGDEAQFTQGGEEDFTQGVQPTSPKPSVEPSDKEKNTLPTVTVRKPTQYTPEFEGFWNEYPRGHGNKVKSFQVWKQIDPADRTEVMTGLRVWKESDRWREGFVKHAETWLRDEIWREPPPARKQVVNGHRNGATDFYEMARKLREQEHAT